MLVVANVQSSVGEMIPKTSYFKMIDYFLLYSLNIIILVMVYHTYMTAHILEDFAPNADDMEVEKVLFILSYWIWTKTMFCILDAIASLAS